MWFVARQENVGYIKYGGGGSWVGLGVDVVGEGGLFQNYSQDWDKYALQMSIKLLVSKIVETDFYVTLDADIVVVGGVKGGDFVRGGKGNWVMEERRVSLGGVGGGQ